MTVNIRLTNLTKMAIKLLNIQFTLYYAWQEKSKGMHS